MACSGGVIVPRVPAVIGPLSLEAWFNPPNNPSTYGGIAGYRFGRGANPSASTWGEFYLLQLANTNTLECRFQNSSGTDYSFESVPVTPATWHHAVLTYDGATLLSLYLDGLLYGTLSASGTLGDIGSNAFGIGANYNSVQGIFNPFGGNIAHVALYPALLTPVQVQRHFFARPRSLLVA